MLDRVLTIGEPRSRYHSNCLCRFENKSQVLSSDLLPVRKSVEDFTRKQLVIYFTLVSLGSSIITSFIVQEPLLAEAVDQLLALRGLRKW